MYKKTVLQVWTQQRLRYKNSDYIVYGLGDLLRGTIGLYRLCKRNGYNFVVDISLHPLSSVVETQKHIFGEIIKENKNNIYCVQQKHVNEFIGNAFEHGDVCLLNSSCTIREYNILADESLKKFIKELFIFKDNLNNYMINKLQELSFKEFNIIHFRTGDASFNNKEALSEKYIEIISSIKTSNSILVSDSTYLKEKAKSMGVFTFDHPAVHIAHSENIDDITHTMFEFFLLTKASNIQSYSIHHWQSGFIKIADYIYDVPAKYYKL